MARGGIRSGAGRKRGAANQKTRAVADKAAASGITPLEVMLEVMRFHHAVATNEIAKGDEMNQSLVADALDASSSAAKDAAPYVHPRLAAIEHGGPDGGPLVINVVRFGRNNAS
jgi:methanogenic corrinoid protein MtbC1